MYVYMYVYMYICVCVCVNNYGKDLWTAVPHVLEHIRKGWVKKSPRLYGRRYLVFVWWFYDDDHVFFSHVVHLTISWRDSDFGWSPSWSGGRVVDQNAFLQGTNALAVPKSAKARAMMGQWMDLVDLKTVVKIMMIVGKFLIICCKI